MSDLSNVSLWDSSLEVAVPGAGTAGSAGGLAPGDAVLLRDKSGFFKQAGILGHGGGLMMTYRVTGAHISCGLSALQTVHLTTTTPPPPAARSIA